VRNWIYQHWRNLGATLGRLASTPLASLLNIGVIGIALALPLGLYVVLVNVQPFARDRAPVPQLSIFLATDAKPADAQAITARLKNHAGVKNHRFVPRDAALAELKARSGMADVIDSLNQNPLPDGFIVEARDGSAAALESLREEMKRWPKIAHVQLDSVWARRLDAVLRLGRLVLLLLAGVLAFALAAVTFNTIRLQVLTQREEIEVAKLIGATDAFIQRPFLYYGALLGLAGGLAAWLIVWGGLALLNSVLAELTQLYGASFWLRHLSFLDSVAVCLAAAALGWLGAALSLRRHLAAFDPH
jgi:cell division transport system permease protein